MGRWRASDELRVAEWTLITILGLFFGLLGGLLTPALAVLTSIGVRFQGGEWPWDAGDDAYRRGVLATVTLAIVVGIGFGVASSVIEGRIVLAPMHQ